MTARIYKIYTKIQVVFGTVDRREKEKQKENK